MVTRISNEYNIVVPDKCRNGHDLVKDDFYIDKRFNCVHHKEYGCAGKYDCPKCNDCGEYTKLRKDSECAMCARIKMLKSDNISPGREYEFSVKNLKCMGHNVKIDCCDYICYDCEKEGCCCYGVYHCCCYGESDSDNESDSDLTETDINSVRET